MSRVGRTWKASYKGEVLDGGEVEKDAWLKEEWTETTRGHVEFFPRIERLTSRNVGHLIRFCYFIRIAGRLRYGQRGLIVSEETLLELLDKALKQGVFSKNFARKLKDVVSSLAIE